MSLVRGEDLGRAIVALAEAGMTAADWRHIANDSDTAEVIAEFVRSSRESHKRALNKISSRQNGLLMKGVDNLPLPAEIRDQLLEIGVRRIRDFKLPAYTDNAHKCFNESQLLTISNALSAYAESNNLVSWLTSPPMSR